MTNVRTPDPPELAKGRFTDDVWPVVRVNVVALPATVPAAFRNETLPVQDAAVPEFVLFEAELWRITSAVSVAPRPTGWKRNVLVAVEVVVCAKAAGTATAIDRVRSSLRTVIEVSFVSFVQPGKRRCRDPRGPGGIAACLDRNSRLRVHLVETRRATVGYALRREFTNLMETIRKEQKHK